MNEIFTASKNGHSFSPPSFGNGRLDASCKGGAHGEALRGNDAVIDLERQVQERMLEDMPNTGGRPLASCFSRNI